MIKWRILKGMFMTSDTIVEKGFLSEEEAQEIADICNTECDAYTYYKVEAYQDESVIQFGNIKLKTK